MLSSLHLLPEHRCRYTVFLVGRWLLIHVAPASSPHILSRPAPQICPCHLIFSIPSHLDDASWSIQHCEAVNELISGLFLGKGNWRTCRFYVHVLVCVHLPASCQIWWEAGGSEVVLWGVLLRTFTKSSVKEKLWLETLSEPGEATHTPARFNASVSSGLQSVMEWREPRVWDEGLCKNQPGWIVLWLFWINKRLDTCKVSVHAPWTEDRKGLWEMSENDRGYSEWGNMSRGTFVGGKHPE